MKTSATNKKVRELITGVREKTLIPRPEFQRRVVWRNIDKVNFIDTVLQGYPFPEIYVADGDVNLETGAGTQVLVDGQQRITTLVEYFTSSPSLKLPGHLHAYHELGEDLQRAYLNYDVATRDLGSIPKEEIIEVFRRINMTSFSLNQMEINNAVYEGALKTFAEQMANLDFFDRHRVFTPLDMRRMGDIRYVLTIIITMMAGYFNRDDFLRDFLEMYNDSFPLRNEIEARFQRTITLVDDCRFPEDSRVWKKVDFFSVFIELDRLLERGERLYYPEQIRESLESFFAEVDGKKAPRPLAIEYMRAVIQASNDRINRLRRGKIIESLVSGKPVDLFD